MAFSAENLLHSKIMKNSLIFAFLLVFCCKINAFSQAASARVHIYNCSAKGIDLQPYPKQSNISFRVKVNEYIVIEPLQDSLVFEVKGKPIAMRFESGKNYYLKVRRDVYAIQSVPIIGLPDIEATTEYEFKWMLVVSDKSPEMDRIIRF